MLKTHVILLIVLIIKTASYGQEQFFLCQPKITDTIWTSECFIFLNPITEEVDSLTKIVEDTFMGYASIRAVAEPVSIKYVIEEAGKGQLFYTYGEDIRLAASVEKGVLHGAFVSYLDGDKTTGTFKEGTLDGTIVVDFGDSREYRNYIMGKLDGPYYELDHNGRYIFFRMYRNGLKHGLEFSAHENGMLRYHAMYEKGSRKDGTYYVYDAEGNIVVEQIYKDGKLLKVKEF